uniref:PCI domain-containing protein n=1 Tax=Chromera velia CCMP2878 TaxID=1169474 RepID=A0A0G4FUS5_9ALVE|mmetsp:Transcript_16429/g.33424  ORF Transcript_16429/g.33424 Transcript_16429/m.33424 type:complete len:459 (+) Transcript_16429:204-1580(+)|eukprot:Cvel_3782.t1-p1 / transcript=Cvel_3782.t1 / gene=Cvel_3782 / organism=Chromera_velia_CCMP2878 / gene_product=26S proteasome non-ATPase regulatory subunit 12, putative / transcript_product=26S proteasome non-ATPase regulatory subunit 12, putative / location=Cvel_scaffold158:104905-111594(-) / protein_length=458 / sequence_SO=supercontig / SO=protein_coding / is_pseudo=false
MAEQISSLQETDSLTKDPKAQEDFSREAAETIARASELAAAGRVDEAVEACLIVEKKARQASDGSSASKLSCHVLKMFKEKGRWPDVHEYLQLLPKKRGQLKRAIIDMVQMAMKWLDDTGSEEEKLRLIGTLDAVTDGKIFVEVERARLVKLLAGIKEAKGEVDEAAKLMQEVQVETFGAMDRREKAEFILEQMRLVLARQDFVRCQIISKKINPKLLEAEDFQDLKITFYSFMVRYWLSEGDHMQVAKCFWSIFSTPSVKDSKEDWMDSLQKYLLFLLLAPLDNEQQDMLHKLRTIEEKKMDKMPLFKKILADFLQQEVVAWPMPSGAQLQAHEVFQEKPYEGGSERWGLLRKRIIQHNIKVVAQYYTKIGLVRLAEVLAVTEDECEKETAELVCAKSVAAKIDRPAKEVTFGEKKDSTALPSVWNQDVQKVLDLVNESCHLIQKERMVAAAKAKVR